MTKLTVAFYVSTLLKSYKIILFVIESRDPVELELSGSVYNVGVALGPTWRSECV
jgi:hypothetical protein